MNEISIERLRETLRYDSSSGRLFFRLKLSHRTNVGEEAGYSLRKGNTCYRRITVDSVKMYAHHIVWRLHYGDIAPGSLIDHIDRDGLNNRIENLSLSDKSRNARNSGLRSDNRTGERHIGFCARTNKYKVRIRLQKKDYWVGRFVSLAEAKARRDEQLRAIGFDPHGGDE